MYIYRHKHSTLTKQPTNPTIIQFEIFSTEAKYTSKYTHVIFNNYSYYTHKSDSNTNEHYCKHCIESNKPTIMSNNKLNYKWNICNIFNIVYIYINYNQRNQKS